MDNKALKGLCLGAALLALSPAAKAQSEQDFLQALMGLEKQPVPEAADPKVVSDAALKGSAWQQKVYERGKTSVAMVQVYGGSGSGFIISTDGILVTNAHVVEGMMGAGASVGILFPGRPRIYGTLLASGDKSKLDIAFIQLPHNPHGWNALTLRTVGSVPGGTPVAAVGYPMGIGYSVATGVLSGVNRKLGNTNVTFSQTDAAVNPGNSGGPLIAEDMTVVGMNTLGLSLSGEGGSIGINMAILTDDILRAWKLYKKTGELRPAWLGARFSPSAAGKFTVVQLFDGPAKKAGLKLDDAVVKVDGKPVNDSDALLRAIHYAMPGDVMTLTVKRGDAEQELAVTLEPEEDVPVSIVGSPAPLPRR